MKIPGDNEHLVNLIRMKANKASDIKPKTPYVKPAGSPSVQISAEALEMKNIAEFTKSVPDARMDKVGELKDKIDKGDYSVDTDKLADILSRYL